MLRNNVRSPSRPSGRSGGSKGTKSGSVNTHLTIGFLVRLNKPMSAFGRKAATVWCHYQTNSAVKGAIMLDKAVVDLSHWDEVNSFEDAKNDGVVSIIHKATESNNDFGPTYNQRKNDALAAGLLWGAYHFLRPGNMENQAQYFVSEVREESRSLCRRSRRCGRFAR